MIQVVTHPQITIAPWAAAIRKSALQETLARSRPVLSFALGLPAPELLPEAEIRDAAATALADGKATLQYGPPPDVLREHIVEIMRWRGVACDTSEVFLTSGAQQGLSLLAKLLVPHGGSVACEAFTYTGLLQSIEPMMPLTYAVETDLSSGINIDGLRRLLSSGIRPNFFYINPDGHNPLGVSISGEKRGQLARLAADESLTIVEDDPYGLLWYDGPALPPIKALEPGRVLYVGSFSKIVSPALRAGWIVAPASLHLALSNMKEGADINTATLSQRILCSYLAMSDLRAQIAKLRVAYKRRRDKMLEMLAGVLPLGSRWTIPSGGVFVWVQLPERYDAEHLLERAMMEHGIAFLPGTAFSVRGDCALARRSLRLNFSHCREDQIEEGIERIGQILRDWS